jgi:glycine hydroxymethyltransferase
MTKRDFQLVTGGTDNHLLLANVHESFGIDGKVAEETLDAIGLTLNKNAVPDDTLPPFRPSGIRLGTPALTTRGLTEGHMAKLAEWMAEAIKHREDTGILEHMRAEVEDFAKQFPLPSDSE